VADELAWEVEAIPDLDFVFMRAHRMHFPHGELEPGVFRTPDSGMSVNWDKYASAADTRQQARKNPLDNAVVRMPVIEIRRVGHLTVEHTPKLDNRAHSEVYGLPRNSEALTETRVLLLRIAEIVIPLDSSGND
jgi:hypothetical protein